MMETTARVQEWKAIKICVTLIMPLLRILLCVFYLTGNHEIG